MVEAKAKLVDVDGFGEVCELGNDGVIGLFGRRILVTRHFG